MVMNSVFFCSSLSLSFFYSLSSSQFLPHFLSISVSFGREKIREEEEKREEKAEKKKEKQRKEREIVPVKSSFRSLLHLASTSDKPKSVIPVEE